MSCISYNHICISKYRPKTGIHFTDTTVGLARKTL